MKEVDPQVVRRRLILSQILSKSELILKDSNFLQNGKQESWRVMLFRSAWKTLNSSSIPLILTPSLRRFQFYLLVLTWCSLRKCNKRFIVCKLSDVRENFEPSTLSRRGSRKSLILVEKKIAKQNVVTFLYYLKRKKYGQMKRGLEKEIPD